MMRPGRNCPLHYRYAPTVFANTPTLEADTLYVVGGLYGNRRALEEVLEMVAQERGSTLLIFNGDFNWFNLDDSGFAAVNSTVLSHCALRGNVETELGDDNSGAGCGCAYPASVPDAEVDRSNEILSKLRDTARRFPGLLAQLAALPMYGLVKVGALRIGIVHGDATSLAGWQFDVSSLDDSSHRNSLHSVFSAAQVDGFASSHTCLPALRKFRLEGSDRFVINNGAAGMPNFRNTQFGVLSRISVRSPRSGQSLYGRRMKGCYVDALAIRYNSQRWLDDFIGNWPAGSPGHASYFKRMTSGPEYGFEQAAMSPLRSAVFTSAKSPYR
jgi:hypothetical protein